MNQLSISGGLVRIIVILILLFTVGCGRTRAATVELEPYGDSNKYTGRVHYEKESYGGWALTVELDRVEPNKVYWFALNSTYPGSDENEVLTNLPGGGFYDNPAGEREGYCDFAKVSSDAKGRFAQTFPISLPARDAAYSVKFLIKDPSQAGNVILQAPQLSFVVKPARPWPWLILVWIAVVILAGVLLYAAARLWKRGREIQDAFPDEEAASLQEEDATIASKGKRKRSKKTDVSLKTHAAIVYKAEHSDATEAECANAVGIPRTTLAQQRDWRKWSVKIDQAAASGRLTSLRAELDRRTGQIIPVQEE
jgi:hypothetical protein